MTTLDDLSVFNKEELAQALTKLDELMSQDGKIVLVGAGCSKSAGLPLTEELTTLVLEHDSLDKVSREILNAVQTSFSGSDSANIEDYLSEIIDLLAIVIRREERCSNSQSITIEGLECSIEDLKLATTQIKSAIAQIISSPSKPINISTHRKFLEIIHRPRRPGNTGANKPIDYLCLNYDTILEDSFAMEKISFSDGLNGGATAWWEPECFSRGNINARLFKLHGSISWREIDGDPLPRRISESVKLENQENTQILIWPASTKYRETQIDPYAQLIAFARESLCAPVGSQKILITCGYRFADSHINIELERAMKISNGRLTVCCFTSEDEPTGKLKEWHSNPSLTESLLVFSNKGFFHGAETYRSNENLTWWKFENLTRLLGGER